MTVKVKDRFAAVHDAALPTLTLALDPDAVRQQFKHDLTRLAGQHGVVRVRRIRVARHKPGRRCVIEYDLRVERLNGPREAVTLIGKVRAGRSGKVAYELLDALWGAGFAADSGDGVSVPEPIATIPEFAMWLQRKVPGTVASELLAEPGGIELGRRIAEAAHKLHMADVPTDRRHTMADELRILRDCLRSVADGAPRLAKRIDRVLAACERLGASTNEPVPSGIHRDFYADQVIVDGARLHLLDFDLYCEGDPALDVGNFLGHVTEQGLRTLGSPDALADVEQALEDRFVELAGEAIRPAVRSYATLTLARHVYLSTQLPKRWPFTERILEVCEERLAALAPARI